MAAGDNTTPVTRFYSYSHDDEDLRQQLDEHLAHLRWAGRIARWHDRMIGAGDDEKDGSPRPLKRARDDEKEAAPLAMTEKGWGRGDEGLACHCERSEAIYFFFFSIASSRASSLHHEKRWIATPA